MLMQSLARLEYEPKSNIESSLLHKKSINSRNSVTTAASQGSKSQQGRKKSLVIDKGQDFPIILTKRAH